MACGQDEQQWESLMMEKRAARWPLEALSVFPLSRNDNSTVNSLLGNVVLQDRCLELEHELFNSQCTT